MSFPLRISPDTYTMLAGPPGLGDAYGAIGTGINAVTGIISGFFGAQTQTDIANIQAQAQQGAYGVQMAGQQLQASIAAGQLALQQQRQKNIMVATLAIASGILLIGGVYLISRRK